MVESGTRALPVRSDAEAGAGGSPRWEWRPLSGALAAGLGEVAQAQAVATAGWVELDAQQSAVLEAAFRKGHCVR